MRIPRCLSLLVLAALVVLCAGCAQLQPAHLTVFCERDMADANSRVRQRTTTGKTGASLTWDFK